jgi:hypothetical protein
MSSDGPMLREFLKHQMMKPVSTTPMKTHSSIVDPGVKAASKELTFEDIVSKKPKAKKVAKFIQGMIDEIVAEQD